MSDEKLSKRVVKRTDELFRQTGRTTKMIKTAITFAEQGKAVLIVLSTKSHTARIRSMLSHLAGIAVETYPDVGNGLIDWSTLDAIGKYRYHKVFIDHEVIYHQNQHILAALEQYNPSIEIDGDIIKLEKPKKSLDNEYCLAA